MNAAADYAAAKAMLTRPVPAYVSYTVHSHVKVDAIVKDTTSRIVVRTRDGKVIKGDPGAMPASIGKSTGKNTGNEPVTDPAFRPGCYDASGARTTRFEDRELEAITLRGLCTSKSEGQQDFDTLYIDPKTGEPVAAVGTSQSDQHVDVRLEQRFTRVGDRALPSTLYVRVQGSGLMFWLDVDVNEQYSDFRFSNTEP
jgi:hypothetical protein